MTLDKFLEHLRALQGQGWRKDGSEIRNEGCDCPIIAVARHLGVEGYLSNYRASKIGVEHLGLGKDDARLIVDSADGWFDGETRNCRKRLLAAVGL